MAIPGRRAIPARPRGQRDRGWCPECKENCPISQVTGKVLRHGFAGDMTGDGCAGRGGRPLTRAEVRELGLEG